MPFTFYLHSQLDNVNLYFFLHYLSEFSDYLKLPTKEVTDLLETSLMQNEKARGFIISGFPRDSIDLTTYLERVGRVDGVILLNWHESAILTQIDFGAKQGMVDLDDANTELLHFKKEGIPVAEYFDYKQQLYVVRNPFLKIFYCQLSSKLQMHSGEIKHFSANHI